MGASLEIDEICIRHAVPTGKFTGCSETGEITGRHDFQLGGRHGHYF